MIDHMVWNSKKWYEGQMPNYIGKKIKLPLKPIPFYGDPNPYNGTGDVKTTILEITEDGSTATTTSGSFNYAGTICQVVIQTCGIVLNNRKDTKKINLNHACNSQKPVLPEIHHSKRMKSFLQ